MLNRDITATLLLLLGTLFWGMTFVFIKEGIAEINLYNFLVWRFAIAATILWLMFPRMHRKLTRQMVIYGIVLGMVLSIGYITQTVGLVYTSASKAAFITGLSVVFVPVMMALTRQQRPSAMQGVAVIMAAIGLALLTLSSSIAINPGDVWVFVCAIAFAGYIILVGKYTKIFASIPFTVIQLYTVAGISFVIAAGTRALSVPRGYIVWQAIIFCALFATSFMYAIQNRFQKFISEVKAAIIFSFEPLFAAITAWFYLHEQLTARIMFGGAFIFAGMLFAELRWSDVRNIFRGGDKRFN